jgi:LysM repeat protein
MRLLLVSVFLAAGLIVWGGVSSFANETTKGSTNSKGQTEEMKGSSNQGTAGEMTKGTSVIDGEITDIQGDTVMVKDEMGNIQSIKLSGTEKMHNLRTKDLKVGDRVHAEMKNGHLVSFYKEEAGPGSSEMKSQESGNKMEGTAGSRQYTVKNGDTLAGIAQKTLGSSARWKEIAQLNGISDPNAIHVGQRLTLPETAENTSGTNEEGTSGTMEEGTKGMKGNTGTMEEGTKGNTETTPEQVAPNPNPQEGSQPLRRPPTDENQESGQGNPGTNK